MRLLTCGQDGGLTLTNFRSSDLPPYAILSHTWIDGEEVTLEDLTNGTGNDKNGYNKILFCGNQAAKDGLQHFWVDTCCIDKKSSAELAQAVNSMFRWYQNAENCYVYLSDVPSPGVASTQQNPWEADFRKSRWFKRGWTLQELLAPKSVEFFSSRYERIGDKVSLEKHIHEVTGIPFEALWGHSLDNFSISERMAWAARRETTEEEDGAYCLFGIFGIFLPVIYGEGKESAFKRLEKEVADTSKNNDYYGNKVQRAPLFDQSFRNLWEDASGAPSQIKIIASSDHLGPSKDLNKNSKNLSDSRTRDKMSLFQAIIEGQKDRVEEILDSDDVAHLIACRSPRGQTPLHVATEMNDEPMARLLLNKGASMDLRDSMGRTAFTLAVQKQSAEVGSMLIDRGCSLGNSISLLPELFENADDVSPYRTMLQSLQMRLNKEKSKDGPFWLHRAVQQDQIRFLRALLEAGFDPNTRDGAGTCAIHHAVMRCNKSALELLTNHHADVEAYVPPGSHSTLPWTEKRDYTPLVLAAQAVRTPELISFLISKGANPNYILPQFQDNALHGVCSPEFDNQIARALIEGGTDINHVSTEGRTVLYWTCVCNNVDLLRLILAQPALNIDVRASNSMGGVTALQLSIHLGRPHLVKMLLEHDPPPNLAIRDSGGMTPLGRALRKMDLRCVQSLLKKGAILEGEDENDQKRALEIARQTNQHDLVRMLCDD